MPIRKVEEKFENHCAELIKIIEDDEKMYRKLIREDGSFFNNPYRKDLRNAQKQLRIVKNLLEVRKSNYTI